MSADYNYLHRELLPSQRATTFTESNYLHREQLPSQREHVQKRDRVILRIITKDKYISSTPVWCKKISCSESNYSFWWEMFLNPPQHRHIDESERNTLRFERKRLRNAPK